MPEVLGSGDFDALSRMLDARYSCRAYLDREVPRDMIGQIVTAAQRTPSWCNTQPWHLHVTSKTMTDRLRQLLPAAIAAGGMHSELDFPERYEGVFDDRRKECAWQLYEKVGVAKGDRAASARQTARNFEFFGAPHVAIVTSEKSLGPYALVDTGSFVTNFMLVARTLGVASIAQAALALCAPLLREELAIPENRVIVCGISFGFEDADHPANAFRTRRAHSSDVVTFIEKSGRGSGETA